MSFSKKKRKRKQKDSIWDLLVEVILWIPEVLVWPFRALFFLGRKIFQFFISN